MPRVNLTKRRLYAAHSASAAHTATLAAFARFAGRIEDDETRKDFLAIVQKGIAENDKARKEIADCFKGGL